MTAERRLLVIDDDEELCSLLSEYLTREGFAMDAVHDGESGAAAVGRAPYCLVVLDVMLPGCDGFETLRRIRASSRVPVIMLTARHEEIDRIVGLELGADDYLSKPFNPRELVARIRAVLRRMDTVASGGEAVPAVLAVDDVELDLGSRTAEVAGEPVTLTAAEFALLEVMVRSAGRVVPREELSSKGLGRNLTRFDRSIDVHVSNLRKKLGLRPGGGQRIRTVRSAGYLFVRPAGGS